MLNEDDILKLVDGIGINEKSVDISAPAEKEVVGPLTESAPVSPKTWKELIGPQKWINGAGPSNCPTHLRRRRGRPPGTKLSMESRERIRQSKIGVPRSEETKAKISESHEANHRAMPFELLMQIDLSKCKTYLHNRYMNVYIPNPNYEERPFGWYLRLGRCIVEQMLNRPLSPMEDLHYIDRNPLNNDPNNLCVLSKGEHVRLHKLLNKIVPITEYVADAENCIWEDFKEGKICQKPQ
jgi:hypothetical protein